MDLLRKLLYCFNRKERIKAVGLLAMMLAGGISEAIGIGLIVPYIALINDPEIIEKNKALSAFYQKFHFASHRSFIYWVGLVFFVIYLTKNFYSYILIRVQNRFVYSKEVSLSRSLLRAYLRQPYMFHLQKNSAELMNNLGRCSHMFQGVLIPLITTTIEGIVIVSVVGVLILVKPIPAVLAACSLGILTAGFYFGIKKKVKKAGRDSYKFSEKITKALQQSLAGIKETKILGREEFFVTAYSENLSGYVDTVSFISRASQVPRLGLEVLAVLGIVIAVCITEYRGQNLTSLLPTLGLFGLAVVRLMPSLNRILSNLALIRASKESVDVVYRDLREFPDLIKYPDEKVSNFDGEVTKLQKSLDIIDVSYRYPGATVDALKDISLKIPKGQSVAFIGQSGAGKSTLVDLVLGLLEPTSGDILIDDKKLKFIRSSWQRSVGYIPQNIYLIDDSIRANIAFGVPPEEIDDAQVWAALRAAQLETFVRGLPSQLETFVGERGIRISGGQKQRIGIARALYHNPEILILDEATSALDHETEKEVSEAINSFSGQKTMIVIAHRLTTAEKCDKVFKFSNGKIVATGSYGEVCLGL